MTERSVFTNELKALFESELCELAHEPLQEHIFSQHFEKKMTRLANACPNRGLIFTAQHRGRAYAAAAVLALAVLVPFVYMKAAPALTAESSSDDVYKTKGGYSVMADYDIYGMYSEYALSYYTKKSSPLAYNTSPDLTGKIHSETANGDMTARPVHISDGRYYSEAILIVEIKSGGEVRHRENKLGVDSLYTEAEVIYDIYDKNSELSAKMPITLSVSLLDMPVDVRFEDGRRMLVMADKLDDGVYSPVLGFDSCFYIDDSGVQCTDLAEGKADITVTSLTDTPACTKYDGLPLYMAVYDMQNGEDIFDKTDSTKDKSEE